MRPNDQFNTTIYGHSDRHRGLKGSLMIVFMGPMDTAKSGLSEGESTTLITDCSDGLRLSVDRLAVTSYVLPGGCLGDIS